MKQTYACSTPKDMAGWVQFLENVETLFCNNLRVLSRYGPLSDEEKARIRKLVYDELFEKVNHKNFNRRRASRGKYQEPRGRDIEVGARPNIEDLDMDPFQENLYKYFEESRI